MVGAGEVTWHERGFEAADLDDAWYVIAATDDPEVNEQVVGRGRGAADLLRARRRRDPRPPPGRRRSAGTPGSPSRCSATATRAARPRVRDEILEGLREGTIVAARTERDRTPGVVLVGGGPGDPELISVAGRKALMEADVVVADRLAPRELLGELPPDVELIDVAKLPRGRSAQQEEINRVIVERALAGQAGGPVQGRRQLRLRPRLRGGHRLPRGRRAGHRHPRPDQPDRGARRSPASR